MARGLIRKAISNPGFTPILEGETKRLRFGIIRLSQGENFEVQTEEDECGFVLIYGHVRMCVAGESYDLGPRTNPFEERPEGMIAGRRKTIVMKAIADCLLGVGRSRAQKDISCMVVRAHETGGGSRGDGNWKRDVRFCLWNDNTPGEQLMMGETVIPAGNWSTFPPHRHEEFCEGEENAYDEAFFYLFREEKGFGFAWQYDAYGENETLIRFESGDTLFMDEGYHSIVCGPVCDAYQLTVMAGSRRQSIARVDSRFSNVLESRGLKNPYRYQKVKA